MKYLARAFIALTLLVLGAATYSQYMLNAQLNARITYLEKRSYEQDTDLINLYGKTDRLNESNGMILDFFQSGGFKKVINRMIEEHKFEAE